MATAKKKKVTLPAAKVAALLKRIKANRYFLPKVGDVIYVRTSLYIDHGEDDVEGGLAVVTKVEEGISAGEKTPFVATAQHPGDNYNWKMLWEQQSELQKRFGKQVAYEDPDYNDYGAWDS